MPEESLPVGGGASAAVHALVENVTLGIELLAIALVVVTIIHGTARYLAALVARPPDPAARPAAYQTYRERVGRALLLGLELLVAADVIRTVALEPTLNSLAALGLLVVIRTFLSWSLVVEIEGRWPWQARRRPDAQAPSLPPPPPSSTPPATWASVRARLAAAPRWR
jgi:uncharacterized membrane protein